METDKFKLGLFLILSFVIVCFLFVVFGLFDYGQKKVHIVTLFEESVQGLEVGSTVQLRGVPIGRVKDITISMHDKLIRVDMEIEVNKVRMQPLGGEVETEVTEENFYHLMKTEISKGLCAQLQMNGITGGKSIGLDYIENKNELTNFATPGFHSEGLFYMPSRPSTMIDLRKRLLLTLEKVAAIDFKGIAARTERVLDSADRLISNPKLESAIKNLDSLTRELEVTVKNINGTVTPERLERLTTETQATLEATRKLVTTLEKTVGEARVGETTEAIRDASTTVSENKRVIRETLLRLGSALDRLSELLQTLEENPQSIIRGKQ